MMMAMPLQPFTVLPFVPHCMFFKHQKYCVIVSDLQLKLQKVLMTDEKIKPGTKIHIKSSRNGPEEENGALCHVCGAVTHNSRI